MISKVKFLLGLALVSSNCFAEWSNSTVDDELRKKETSITSIKSAPINIDGPELSVKIYDIANKNKKADIVFSIDTSTDYISCNDGCDVSMRFDDANVTSERFLPLRSNAIAPAEQDSIIRAINSSEKFYIEINTNKGRVYQYKFGGNTSVGYVKPKPEIDVFGFKIGDDVSVLGDKFNKGKDSEVLYGYDIPISIGYPKIKKVEVSVLKGKISSVSFSVKEAKTRREINKYFKSKFGTENNILKEYIVWPNEDKVFSSTSVNAYFFHGTYTIEDKIYKYFSF
jgi:hypothetical protein